MKSNESVEPENPTLKVLREVAGYTQEDLAKRVNLSLRIVGEWERGQKMPKFDNAIALARELGVSLKTLARAMRLDVSGVPDDIPPVDDRE